MGFTLDNNSYGINVAKIKEIINYMPVTPVPNAHPSIEGIFMPRDRMITAIDLKNCLQSSPNAAIWSNRSPVSGLMSDTILSKSRMIISLSPVLTREKMDTKILLENGTNELEVLEFTLDNNSYGINVAKFFDNSSCRVL